MFKQGDRVFFRGQCIHSPLSTAGVFHAYTKPDWSAAAVDFPPTAYIATYLRSKDMPGRVVVGTSLLEHIDPPDDIPDLFAARYAA